MAVTFNLTDLEFILTQIKMAEAGQPPDSPHLAFGLREVAGTNNSSVPGQTNFGAADQGFPALTDPLLRTITVNLDGTAFDPNPGIDGDTATTSYIQTTADPTLSLQQAILNPIGAGWVYDSAPRTISNLIVDQSTNNPAAVAAQLAALAQLGTGYLTAFNPATPADSTNGSLFISNITPDAGLSAPFNSWFTFFGQFFDHGVDLISKGGNGTVFIPLATDDPLYSTAPGANNFMVLTRAADVTVTPGADGVFGTSDDVHTHDNTLTPFVDQSQTYSSHPAHQVFLREYATQADGTPYATGRLLSHAVPLLDAAGNAVLDDAGNPIFKESMATWADVKANALLIGIQLNDTTDLVNIPLVKVDAYGKFVPGANGLAQLVTSVGADGKYGTADDLTVFGSINADGSINAVSTTVAAGDPEILRIGHAFLNDINATADPVNHQGPGFLVGDADGVLGTTLTANANYDAAFVGTATFLLEKTQFVAANPNFDAGSAISATNQQFLKPGQVFDNELLDAHYIAGDGRVNENIGLTAVHEIFHDEHNRLIAQIQGMVQAELDAGDSSFASEWLVAGANLNAGHVIQANEWNGERLFQAAKFGTETQYQHLVFEEFARKVAPTIHLFGNNNIHLDPLITSEFANVVYRFGHSMLDENVNRYVIHEGSPGDPLNGTPEMYAAFTDAAGNQTSSAFEADGFTPTTPNSAALIGTPIINELGLIAAFTNPLGYLSQGANAAGEIILGSTNQVGNEIDEFVTGALRNNLLGLPLDLAALNIARGRDTGVAGLNVVRNQFYNEAPTATNDNPAYHDTNLKPYASWDDFGQFLKHPESLINFVAAYGSHHTITDADSLVGKRTAALDLVDHSRIGSANFDQDAYDFMHSLGQYVNDPTHLNPLAVHTDWSTGSITGLDNVDLWIGGLAEKQTLFGGLLGTTFNYVFETQLEALQDGDRLYYLPRIEGMHFASEIEANSFAELIAVNTGIKHLPASIFLTPEYVVEAATVTDDPSTWLRNKDTGALLVEKLPDGTVHFIGDDNFLGNTMVLGGTPGNDRLVAGHADDDTVWGDEGDDYIDGGNGNDFLFGGAGNDTISDSSGDDVIHGDAGDDTVFAGIGDDIVFGGDGNDYIEGGHGIDGISGGLGNDIILGGEDDDEMQGNEGDDWMEGGTGGDILVGDQGAPTGQVPLFGGNDVLDGGAEGDKMQGFSGDDIMLGQGGFDKFLGGLGFDWGSYENETHGVDVDQNLREFIPAPGQAAGDAVRDFWVQTEGLSGSAFNDDLKGEAGGRIDALNELSNTQLIAGLQDGFNGARNFFAPGTPVNFSGGNIILGGGGSDRITGDSFKVALAVGAAAQTPPIGGGNDIIDGDAFLHVALDQGYVAGSNIIREIRFANGAGDLDTAVYNDNINNYTITDANGTYNANSISLRILVPNAQGFVTITHNPGNAGGGAAGVVAVNDGTDQLRNIERLQFADQTIEFNIGANAAGTIAKDVATNAAGLADRLPTAAGGGAATLTLTDTGPGNLAAPAAGDLLSFTNALAANYGIADADGIVGPIHLQWQVQQIAHPGWVNVNGATGTTFVPGDFFVGDTVRLEASFVDGLGVTEVIDSAATVVLGANATINHAPTIVQQTSPPGLPDTTAVEDRPISQMFLPFAAVFTDDVTPVNSLVFTATLANGQPLNLPGAAAGAGNSMGLFFDTASVDALGNVVGRISTAAGVGPGGANFSGPIDVRITATDQGGLSVQDTFRINVTPQNDGPATFAIADVSSPAVLAALPTLFSEGHTLSVTPNLLVPPAALFDPDGNPAAGVNYQWLKDGSVINGAIQTTYTLGATDTGHAIAARATYTDGQGFHEVVTTAAPAIMLANNGQAPLAVVGVNPGALFENQNIRAVLGADPDGGIAAGSATLTWQRDGVDIAGTAVAITPANANVLTYTLTAADAGGPVISAKVTYTDGQGFAETINAVAAPVGFAESGVADWGITGLGQVGRTLTASLITADPDEGQKGFATFQWQSTTDAVPDGSSVWTTIVGATGQSYKIVAADASTNIRVNVSYTDNENFAESVFSGATSIIPNSAPLAAALGASTFAENGLGVAFTVVATDPDLDLLSYTLTGGDAALLSINAAGQITFNASPDFETPLDADHNNVYSFDVNVSDGTFTTVETVSITVLDVAGNTIAGTNGADTMTLVAAGLIPAGAISAGMTVNGVAAAAGAPGATSEQDLITGGLGADNLVGLGGNDTFNYTIGDGADTINGGTGTDAVAIIGSLTGVPALPANDTLNVAFNGSVITGFAGGTLTSIESITADLGGGIDTLSYTTAAGTNVSVNLALGTASGFTSIAGIENVTGGAGRNTLTGDANANILTGGAAVDILSGGRGADTINGGGGADIINYTIGDGADIITGGGGTDTLNIAGLSAADTLTVTLAGGTIIDFNDGSGLATVATVERFNIDLGSGAANTLSYGTTAGNVTTNLGTGASSGITSLLNVANITGGNGNDNLTGDINANVIHGGSGADTITGGLGADSIFGDAGADAISYVFGDGADAIDGGAGNDTLTINGSAGGEVLTVLYDGTSVTTFNDGISTSTIVGASVEAIVAALAGGNDTLSYGASTAAVTVNLGTGTASGFSSISGIENVTGGAGNDNLTGGAGVNILNGGAGNDTINYTLGSGADVIDGGADVDTLNVLGSAGNDTLNVTFNGTALTAVESLTITNVEQISANLGGNAAAGDTLAYSAASAAVTVNLSTATASGFSAVASIENVSGGGGNDVITGDGVANTLAGGGGADILSGGGGNDTLSGGAGNDSLTGGVGADNLTGGAGSDRFIYTAVNESTSAARDTVTDFTIHSGTTINDQFDFSAIDANASLAGDQAFLFVANGGAFTAANGQVHVIANGGNNYLVEGHTAGHATIDFQIALTSTTNLVNNMNVLDFNL